MSKSNLGRKYDRLCRLAKIVEFCREERNTIQVARHVGLRETTLYHYTQQLKVEGYITQRMGSIGSRKILFFNTIVAKSYPVPSPEEVKLNYQPNLDNPKPTIPGARVVCLTKRPATWNSQPLRKQPKNQVSCQWGWA